VTVLVANAVSAALENLTYTGFELKTMILQTYGIEFEASFEFHVHNLNIVMEVTLSSLEELIKMILTHINISLDSIKLFLTISFFV
jgi:hypothetical protein